MLRGLRKATSNWIGKIIMAAVVTFLVVSFAIWGIGDIFRGFGVSTVAKIGRTEITIDQFRQFYNDRLQQISRQIGKPLTPDQARAIGIDQQILTQVIAEAVLDERARQIGLGISDAEVIRQIAQEPAFRGVNGQFDPQRFAYLVRQAGFTEQRFIAEQRRVSLRRQLAGSVGGDVKAPQTTVAAISRFENEERSVEYVVLGAAQAGEIAEPTPEQLLDVYNQRKFLFRAPEYRKVLLLTLSPDALAKTVEVSDEDAKKAYEASNSRYTTPEKRQVLQIAFPSAEEAKAAQEKLAGGMTFEALAAERNVPQSDLDLGLVSKAEMLDPAIAAAAFGLKEGETSAPVAGRFTTAIVKVTRIEPGKATPFAEVEAQIKQDLARDRARAQLGELRDKIEDELAAGSRLDEIGAKLHLPVQSIEAVDRSGRAPDGQPVALPKDVDVLGPVFATQVGIENEALQIPNGGGYVWYEAAGVTPSRERAFDEVKDKVAERWRNDQISERLTAKANAIADKLKAGGWFGEIAAADGLKLETATGLKRRGGGPLPAAVVGDVFKTPKDGVAAVAGAGAVDRIVFKVTDIKAPGFDAQSADTKKLIDTLNRAWSDDVMAQYIAKLQDDLGVKINQTALNQAMGRGSSADQ